MQVGEQSNRMPPREGNALQMSEINQSFNNSYMVGLFIWAPPPFPKVVLEALLCNGLLQYSLDEDMTDQFVLSLACGE